MVPKSPRVSLSSCLALNICFLFSLFCFVFVVFEGAFALHRGAFVLYLTPNLVYSYSSSLDGVTVAKAITLKDKFENLGAR